MALCASNDGISNILIVLLCVFYSNKVLHGSVDVHAEAQQDGVKELVLDTKTLSIKAVSTAGDHSVKIAHSFGPEHEVFGRALHIPVGGAAGLKHGEHVSVRVEYETSPTALAIQWLSPRYMTAQLMIARQGTVRPNCVFVPSAAKPQERSILIYSPSARLSMLVPWCPARIPPASRRLTWLTLRLTRTSLLS